MDSWTDRCHSFTRDWRTYEETPWVSWVHRLVLAFKGVYDGSTFVVFLLESVNLKSSFTQESNVLNVKCKEYGMVYFLITKIEIIAVILFITKNTFSSSSQITVHKAAQSWYWRTLSLSVIGSSVCSGRRGVLSRIDGMLSLPTSHECTAPEDSLSHSLLSTV